MVSPRGRNDDRGLLLGSQAAFDLGDEVIGQAQGVEGLVEGFDIALGSFLLALMALFGAQTPPCDGFGLFFDVLSSAGHGAFLRLMASGAEDRRKPCPMWKRHCQRKFRGNGLCTEVFEKKELSRPITRKTASFLCQSTKRKSQGSARFPIWLS